MLLTFLTILKYIFLAIIIVILGFMAFVLFSFREIVPFVPTPRRIARKMAELADIKKHEKICDLGSGSGRIIFAVAKMYKDNLIVGIEKSLTLRLVSKLLLLGHPFLRRRIQVINRNFFNIELSEYDVIFAFVTTEALRRLMPKLKTLKSGSRVITYMFSLPDDEAFTVSSEHVSSKDTIYIYTKV